MKYENKEKIKDVVFEMALKSNNNNALDIARQLCEAIEYLDNYPVKGGIMTGEITLKY